MIFNSIYLDKKKFLVLVLVFFLLSSGIWFEVRGQEIDQNVNIEESGQVESQILENLESADLSLIIENHQNDFEEHIITQDLTETINSSQISSDFENSNSEQNDLVPLVFYDSETGLKEVETEVETGRVIEIDVEDRVLQSSDDYWGKEVTVSSDEHFERSVKVYVDIAEMNFESIELIWNNRNIDVTNDPSFNLEYYDSDNNGYFDRISFDVPHLSEQNFEIRLFYSTNNTSSNLELNAINSPSQVITSGNILPFNFTVDYYNITSVFCDFEILSGSNIKYSNSGLLNSVSNVNITSFLNGNYSWDMECRDYYLPSNNDSLFGSFEIALNYTPNIQFIASYQNITVGQTVNFGLNVTTLDNRSLSYHILFGGSSFIGPLAINNFNAIFLHQFNLSGNYNVSLTIIDGSVSYNKIIPISVSSSASTSTSLATIVELGNPSNNAVISSQHINFSYSARSNVTVSNCTFNLYYFNSSSLGSLVYHETNYSILINSTDVVSLHNFDEGDYSWEVECYNSEFKRSSSSRDFTFDTISNATSFNSLLNINNSYERREDIDKLLSDIDNFLDKTETFGFEEKEVVELLGFSEELISYKRKLNQFRQDLGHNINFIQNAADKEKRKKEIYSEIDYISTHIPLNLEVTKFEEYVKNSIDSDLEKIVSDYASSENLILSNREIKNLASYNKQLQDLVKVSSKATYVVVEYLDREVELTLVSRDISSDSDKGDIYLEVLSDNLKFDNVSILNKNTFFSDHKMFYVAKGDLLNKKIAYYFNSIVPMEDIKISDTLLFSEDSPTKVNSFTGFSILLGSGEISGFALYFSWAIFGFILLMIFVVVSRNFSIRYNQGPDLKLANKMIYDAKNSLIRKDITRAKEDYSKVKKIYSYLSNRDKKIVYGKIGKLLLDIDRFEVASLIEEYIDCVRSGRKEGSIAIYNKIRLSYNRLPNKFKEKVHQRLLPYMGFNGQ